VDANTKDVLIAVIPAAIALIGTLLVSWRTNVTTRRHLITAQWWERKASVYTDIIRAFADLEFVLNEWESHFTLGTGFSDDYQAKIGRVRAKAEQNLKILAGTAPFLITKEAGERIRRFCFGLEVNTGTGDPVEEIKRDLESIALCRAFVATVAERDLKH
jgi:hypothetical protein